MAPRVSAPPGLYDPWLHTPEDLSTQELGGVGVLNVKDAVAFCLFTITTFGIRYIVKTTFYSP